MGIELDRLKKASIQMIRVYGLLKIINYAKAAAARYSNKGDGVKFTLLREAVSFVGSTSKFSATVDPDALRRLASMQLVTTLPYISIRPQPT